VEAQNNALENFSSRSVSC